MYSARKLSGMTINIISLDILLSQFLTSPFFQGPCSQSYGFYSSHAQMWGLDPKEGWVSKNWCFQTGTGEDSWESLEGSNQSILEEISPEYLLEGLMLKLKFQYFVHLMQRADSLGKTVMLGKIEGRRRGWQSMRWLDGITNSVDLDLSKLQR